MPRNPLVLRRVETEAGEGRLYVSPEFLHQDPANARKHPPENVEGIAASLQEYGQQTPVKITPTGMVVKGNGTLMAARKLGMDEVWVSPTDLEGVKLVGYGIADNRTGDTSSFDDLILAKHLEANRSEPEPAYTGFSDAETDALLEKIAREAAGDVTEAEGDSQSVGSKWEIIVQCSGERQQRELFNRLASEGYECKVLTL